MTMTIKIQILKLCFIKLFYFQHALSLHWDTKNAHNESYKWQNYQVPPQTGTSSNHHSLPMCRCSSYPSLFAQKAKKQLGMHGEELW